VSVCDGQDRCSSARWRHQLDATLLYHAPLIRVGRRTLGGLCALSLFLYPISIRYDKSNNKPSQKSFYPRKKTVLIAVLSFGGLYSIRPMLNKCFKRGHACVNTRET